MHRRQATAAHGVSAQADNNRSLGYHFCDARPACVEGLPRKTIFDRGYGYGIPGIQASLATDLLKGSCIAGVVCGAQARRVFASKLAVCVKTAGPAKSCWCALEVVISPLFEGRNCSGASICYPEALREGWKAADAVFVVLSSPGVTSSQSHSASPRRCLYPLIVSCAPHTRRQYMMYTPEQL